MYTRSTTVAEAAADRKWFIVDLAGETVGCAAHNGTLSVASTSRPTHHISMTAISSSRSTKVVFTGQEWADKTYYRHTGYVGGLKSATAQ